jgi:dTDP-4-dehydrorhamnose reductase
VSAAREAPPSPERRRPLELWGGVECTVNRVGDRYFDQLAMSGHRDRLDDLDAIASLGVTHVRYPVLWELTAPSADRPIDWSWAHARLERLRELGLKPIVGFVHHGSGPPDTHLLDSKFANGVARYAAEFARRFPWVDAYTPINEPLTTARFSALYGHWYPHAADDRSFVRALLNQLAATRAAMRAVRAVNPSARLVQTEDFGRIGATSAVAYQAEFENERRWLTWDLLSGRVDHAHALRAYLEHNGASALELDGWIAEPCAPDVLGVNHYVTSNRFLHERHELFPAHCRGTNGRQEYADVEEVRVPGHTPAPFRSLLMEVWQRYGRPLAVTEAHIGCTREEQMRWLQEIWSESAAARADGADVLAVTAWALFGSFNWETLVTRDTGHYEPGAFDVRVGAPRPTAIARLLRALPDERHADEHLSRAPGWWRRKAGSQPLDRGGAREPRRRELLIVGAGTLGTAFARVCERRGLAFRLCARRDLDICDEQSLAGALADIRPWGVVNAAGYVRVDDAEHDQERCFRDNSVGPRLVAAACASRGLPLVTYSSDLVFDGEQESPYAERDAVGPLNVYGASKAQAERWVLRAHEDALVIRTSAFFGPWDDYNFVTQVLARLAAGEEVAAIGDLFVSPTYVPHLVDASLDLLIDRAKGIWHLANQGASNWAELALRSATLAGVSTRRLKTVSCSDAMLAARRPRNSALSSERGCLLPTLDHALEEFVGATRSH